MNKPASSLIETKRLRLRPTTYADLGALAKLWNNPQVMRFLPTGAPRSIAETEVELKHMLEHWQEYGFGTWAIMLKGQNEFIGYCGLQYLHVEPGGVTTESLGDEKEIEIIAGIEQKFWGKGFVSEATYAVLHYGFKNLHLKRIIAAIHPHNNASRRILEKMGMCPDPSLNYYVGCPHFILTERDFKDPLHSFEAKQPSDSESS